MFQENSLIVRLLKKSLIWLLYLSGGWLFIRRKNRHRIAILMYHGVVQKDVGAWTQVPIDRFRAHMEYLKAKCVPVSLSDAVTVIKSGRTPSQHAVVVTFDDGFVNNYTIAYPILEQHGIPASLFLTTGFIDKYKRFEGLIWTDYLRLIILRARAAEIDLTDYGLEKYPAATGSARSRLNVKLSAILKGMPADLKNELLDMISKRADPARPLDGDGVHASLSWKTIVEMYRGGLVELGAHSVNHEILARLTRDRWVEEMMQSRAEIDTKIGARVRYFAYPNGTKNDFNSEIRNDVSKLFDAGLTTVPGLNGPGCDAFAMARLPIGNDTSMREFKLLLSGTYEFVDTLFDMFWQDDAN